MSVAAGLARLADGKITVALGSDGADVSARVQPTWTRKRGTLSAVVTFGPYLEPVLASQVLVHFEGETPDVIPFNGPLQLPVGVPFLFDVEVKIG